MNCLDCERCIEDLMGRPYCFIGQFTISDGDVKCEDFLPVEKSDEDRSD